MSFAEKTIPLLSVANSGIINVCKCNENVDTELPQIPPPRFEYVLSNLSRTEKYLRERRIPELLRFLMTKLIVEAPEREKEYLEKILDDCMLYRAGHGSGPFLYDKKHLEAVVKSFDPGDHGWLRAGQVRRAYVTLGLTPPEQIDDRVPIQEVLDLLVESQKEELIGLLSAGYTNS